MKDINIEYMALLNNIRQFGEDQYNARTNHHVRALPAQHITLDMSRCAEMQIPAWRKMYPKSALAEIIWTLMGTTSPEWINKHTSMWELWTEDDGIIPTAYGYRWRRAFGRDQLLTAIEALQKDDSSRQVNVFAWHPGTDGNGAPDQPKNIPCIIGFTVNIIAGKLNMSVYLRSSDVIVGLPYDYMCYAFLVYFLANTLKVKPGILCLHLAHAHYYRVHDLIVHDILKRVYQANHLVSKVLTTDIEAAIETPDAIMMLAMRQTRPSEYNPKPELVL